MATYFVSAATGNDADDGLSEANAWLTIDKAMNTVVGGDKVWVKGDGTYGETATIDTAGTRSNPITFEGYTSTTGDGGQATINGGATRASGILDSTVAGTRLYYVFKNFTITNHTSHGVNTDGNHLVWKNCLFNSNGTTSGSGYNGRQSMFEGCQFSDNSLDGATIGNTGVAVFVGCKFYRNTTDGIDSGVGTLCVGCEFFSNGGNAIAGGAAADAGGFLGVINCTIDGDGDDTTIGVSANTAFDNELVVINTIVYDCATGLQADHGAFENHISRANLVNANATAYTNFSTPTGEVTSAPSFTNEGANDYTLADGSPARNVGYDLAGVGMDIGANQSEDGGGGSGGKNQILTGGAM